MVFSLFFTGVMCLVGILGPSAWLVSSSMSFFFLTYIQSIILTIPLLSRLLYGKHYRCIEGADTALTKTLSTWVRTDETKKILDIYTPRVPTRGEKKIEKYHHGSLFTILYIHCFLPPPHFSLFSLPFYANI